MSDHTRPAVTDEPLIESIRLRWSPRAFADKPIADKDLRTILAAAQWAASSFNEQPWRYIVAKKENPEQFQRALSCLVEKNRLWAEGAAVLMFAAGRRNFTRNEKPNRVWLHDLGAASCQLTLQAMSMGIYVHQMAGINVAAVRGTYNIPDQFEPATGLALGYPGDPDDLPEEFRAGERAERTRMPLSEIIFGDAWGRSAEL